ncbi:DctP family TRAP transporter solute-binding subunit [Campylobacter sp. RM9344]|uniref:DctP family TRAP transporter solute-binding subunit n=1 Tax=Campylobacter californiensis TaxID=1032243 RepID=A0AAW3ZVZ9_9BACT|nr:MULTISPECIES: DctP family TRAP transporter solute-binding subunit [unclassified Campylobacter]MBE2985156.1 DctP family TRAP transporter solute-binding subunit [Campylobacter sp. RM6883]MBE2986733.1 DctP family TRAP transporter solute-binding subunit [Campylobacter sp. RM12919]MBE2988473.1 DctP family TRAP transporter solute-binding subunit [Campylobacter sp. RM12920]MBE2995233.1 DctP family TRAP transporter solute-binding subunit [Campylobacter sp. RM6913]MBE3029510.1 DctP family TRAP trans
MKVLISTILSCAVAVSAFAAEKTYTIKFAHVVAASTPKGKAADFFAKRVEEISGGKIKVQVFPSAQLVDDDRVFGALKLNNVQMAAPSFSKFTPIVPQFQLFDLPFIFADENHLHKVQDGEVGQALKDLVTKKGFVALDYWDAGFKHFSSSTKPIVNPEDAKGQKFRIQSSKVLEEQMKAVGGNPQVLPFSEVYSALQQRVVDATENPLSNFYNTKFHEVQSSLTLSSHGYLGYLVVVSDKFWKSLPEDMKKYVTQALSEATDYEREETAKEDAHVIAELEKYAAETKKLEIFKLDDTQRAKWSEAMQPIYPKFYDIIGKDLVEKTINAK